MIFQKIVFRNWHRFLIDLGANMAPFCLPKSFQILPKKYPKRHQIFALFWHRFFIHFSSNLGPKLEPCWPLFRTLRGDGLGCSPLFCCVGFFFGFFRAGRWGTPSDRAPEPMGYPSWARFSDPFGLGFQRLCNPFCKFCGSFFASISALFSCSFSNLPCWLKGWSDYAKRQQFPIDLKWSWDPRID